MPETSHRAKDIWPEGESSQILSSLISNYKTMFKNILTKVCIYSLASSRTLMDLIYRVLALKKLGAQNKTTSNSLTYSF